VNALYTDRFKKSYAAAPEIRRRQFDKQVVFLLKDLRHPSLRAKIVDETQRIWQARVDGGWRFYFTIEGDTYHLLDIGPHPK